MRNGVECSVMMRWDGSVQRLMPLTKKPSHLERMCPKVTVELRIKYQQWDSFFFPFFFFLGGHPSVLPLFLGCLSFMEKWSLQKGCHTNCWMGARVREGTAGWQWAVKTTWPSRCSFNWCYWFPILPANLNALWVEENLSHCFGEWPAESF